MQTPDRRNTCNDTMAMMYCNKDEGLDNADSKWGHWFTTFDALRLLLWFPLSAFTTVLGGLGGCMGVQEKGYTLTHRGAAAHRRMPQRVSRIGEDRGCLVPGVLYPGY